jgi:FkbM family methyltransferase
VLSGGLSPDDVLYLRLSPGSGYLSFTAEDGSIVLQLDYKDADGTVLMSRATPNPDKKLTWTALARVRVADIGQSVELQIRVTSPTAIEITLERIILGPLDVSIANATRVFVDGEYERFELRRAMAHSAPFDRIVRDEQGIAKLPPEFFGSDAVFDIGMHNGDDTDFYLKSGYHVVAVEANPLLARQGAIRFHDAIRTGQLAILNMGIFDTPGTMKFYINRVHSEWSSFKAEIASRGYETEVVDVATIRPERLLKAIPGPCYIKIDIEGCDALFVDALLDIPSAGRPTHISFEMGFNDTERNIRRLAAAGYDSFAVVLQVDHDGAYRDSLFPVHRTSPEQQFTYRFNRGSSGPFGPTLRTTWLDLDGVLAATARIHEDQRNNRTGIYGEWFDIHARASVA